MVPDNRRGYHCGSLRCYSQDNSALNGLCKFLRSGPIAVNELGVISWRLDADNYETDEELKKICEECGYSYMVFCEVCPEKLPNYDEKIKNFFEEHLHTNEEIRYCVAGSSCFAVRDQNDKWIRVWVKKGGMIILPARIYHCFTLDSDNYIKAR